VAKLTARSVEAARPTAERREIPDGLLRGLYFIIHPTGAKSWAVRYRHHGQSRKHTLGSFPAIDLKTARELGAKALRAVAEGRDPGREKILARATEPDSIEAVTARFLELHCKRVNRERHARETERLLNRHVLPRWRGRPIASITRRDVLAALDRVVEAGAPIEANRTLAAVRKLFNWAVARDIIAVSPCMGVPPPAKETSRDRILTDDEVRALLTACDDVRPPCGALIKLLLLTGQRHGEVAGMRWSEIDVKTRTWTLPPTRTKNAQRHEVPLSAQALALIESQPRIVGAADYVFTTNGNSATGGMSRAKAMLDASMKLAAPWRLHDLRRTVASGLARLGINLAVIERVLNHTSGSFAGIVGVYQRHSFADEKRKALDVWGDFVSELVSDKPAPKKTIKLRGRR
jgi:integrase